MKKNMIINNIFIQVILCEILISLLFYFILPKNVMVICDNFYEKISPYYYFNMNECGPNFAFVNLYYFVALIPVGWLMLKSYPRNGRYIAYVPLFVIMNMISLISFWIWLSGSQSFGMRQGNQLHDGNFFMPTVLLIGSLVWYYISVLFLTERKGN